MELGNSSLRDCPKCRHITVHFDSSEVIGGFCYHKGTYPNTLKGKKQFDADFAQWVEKNTTEMFTCTVCGKRWVDCVSEEYAGGYLLDKKNIIKENISPHRNAIKFK